MWQNTRFILDSVPGDSLEGQSVEGGPPAGSLNDGNCGDERQVLPAPISLLICIFRTGTFLIVLSSWLPGSGRLSAGPYHF